MTIHSLCPRFRVVVAVCALVALAGAGSATAQIRIIKTAGQANPGIFLADFTGPATMRDVLLRTLAQCDWFTVVTDPGAATYTLRAAYSGSPAPTLDLTVTSGAGGNENIRQTTRSPAPNWLVYQAVDSLITRLFKNPGLCASSLAFANGRSGHKEVFVCNFDGTNARQLTHNQTISTEPSWGPRAASLVYTLYGHSVTDVVLMDLANSRQRRLSQFPGLNASADLSPDGRYAALTLSKEHQVDLYVLRVGENAATPLTHDRAVESSPCWSPDGSRICFVSDRAGHPNLYVIPAAGGTAQPLVAGTAEAVSPDWSAVSNKICFATRMYGDYDLAVVDMSKPGREVTVLTKGGGKWESPSWAPDGRHVVCSHQVGNLRELCMVDTLTGKILKITTPGDFSLASWSQLHD